VSGLFSFEHGGPHHLVPRQCYSHDRFLVSAAPTFDLTCWPLKSPLASRPAASRFAPDAIRHSLNTATFLTNWGAFMASDEWYYTVNGAKAGPVSSSKLKQLSHEGKLTPNDHVWKEGMSDWRQASTIKGLFDVPSSAAPIIPPPVVRPSPPRSSRSNAPESPQSSSGAERNTNPGPPQSRPIVIVEDSQGSKRRGKRSFLIKGFGCVGGVVLLCVFLCSGLNPLSRAGSISRAKNDLLATAKRMGDIHVAQTVVGEIEARLSNKNDVPWQAFDGLMIRTTPETRAAYYRYRGLIISR
jgi:hypothetical protein